MRFECDTFGPHLRRERERRGITLDDIAARTKISRSLLAKLERGDVADWPAGIFRRAFFREYAAAVGLDVEGLLQEFQRLYPDPAAEASSPEQASSPAAADLRLTLAVPAAPADDRLRKLQNALTDTALILGAAALLSAAVGHAAAVAATVAIIYHATSLMWSDRTPGALLAARVMTPLAVSAPRASRVARAETRRPEQPRRTRTHRRVVDSAVRGTRALN